MPFPDASFDAVVSAVGVMFAPTSAGRRPSCCASAGRGHHRPGQLDADGLHRRALPDDRGPRPPAGGLAPPPLWGDEDHVRGLLRDGVTELRATRRTYTFRYETAQAFTDTFRELYGPWSPPSRRSTTRAARPWTPT